MSRIDDLRHELAALESLEARAARLRGKRGRLEVAPETLRELEADLGSLEVETRPDGSLTLDMATLVARIDAVLAR